MFYLFKLEILSLKLGPVLNLKCMSFETVGTLNKEFDGLNEIGDDLSNYTDLEKINLKLSFICDNLKEKANEEIKIMKWKYAATCFDKLFFYMVSIGFLVAFVSTILSNLKFYNN
jgi:hypothetical protein